MADLFSKLPWNKKIEVLRTIKGWNQEEAADKCLTNQKAFWSWEKGITYPRRVSRQAIARAFDIAEAEIFGGGN
ncbi:MAG: helix-turn-helix transcriptional regulator [Clostridium sp.]|uniref:helix-turn-helix transcriptional regulator n=1 Tax=Clostridium sp. TaxID=1506 RepID=UPI0025BACAB2|nr:helix-turn-helix transcriptional regulator [Clostridium sp.]MBS4958181.1 helix-turn-helix transcriptional regulator [Clostridium sp.]